MFIALLSALLALVAALHVVMKKRDSRAASAWLALILFLPWFGLVIYLIFGINRIERKGLRVRKRMLRYASVTETTAVAPEEVRAKLQSLQSHLAGIAAVVDRTSRWTLLPGNAIALLEGGDEAYPAMLQAINEAQSCIVLCSYIFDNDALGNAFIEALISAHQRGVEVRVLLDDVGSPRMFRAGVDRPLKAAGIPVGRFLKVWAPRSAAFANLRNHRKLLIVDGALGFTGGMNISGRCLLGQKPQSPMRDLHFRLTGPVVGELAALFAEDWTFTTGEPLKATPWFPKLPQDGAIMARVISQGPDQDIYCMRWVLQAALATAQNSILIATPYFLPDETLITALAGAALRGVRVQILLPERSDVAVADWAMRGELWKVLSYNCEVYLSPPPFDHSKLMLVDSTWVLLGSVNWDQRSLRLNFELAVECYDEALAIRAERWFTERINMAKSLDTARLRRRPALIQVRDACARLLSPYL